MKKLTLLFILLTFFSQNAISQINSSFEKGFNEGFSETLRDAKIIGNYSEYRNSRKCENGNLYSNDPKAEQKLYADGYRCGVKQATKAIPKINKDDAKRLKKRNKERLQNDPPTKRSKKFIRISKKAEKKTAKRKYSEERTK